MTGHEAKKIRLSIIDYLHKVNDIAIEEIAEFLSIKNTTTDKTKKRIIDSLNKTSKDHLFQIGNKLQLTSKLQ